MNTREIFEKVRNHLLEQKCRSLSDGFRCAYRGENGTKCAVGALIDDRFYDLYLEENSIKDPRVLVAVEQSIGRELSFREQQMLHDLQNLHDNYSVTDWESDLKHLAEEHLAEENLK